MNKTVKWILIILGILIAVLIVGKLIAGKGDEGVKVSTEKATKRMIIETVNATGKVYPEVEVKISPDISGLIFTSTSGYTLPVAFTVSMIIRLAAFSVDTLTPSSPLPAINLPTMRTAISIPSMIKIHFTVLFMIRELYSCNVL